VRNVLGSLREFCLKVARHFYALAVGVIGGILGIISAVAGDLQKPSAKPPQPPIPLWIWVPLLAGGFLVAIIWAFHDVRMERDAAQQRAQKAESDLKNTRGELERTRTDLDNAHADWGKTQREREEARRELEAATKPVLLPLEPWYLQEEPYRQPDEREIEIEHRVGIRNPPGNPFVVGVRLEWKGMSPANPPIEGSFPPIDLPQPVPRLKGGDPRIGIDLPPGHEEYWVIATAATGSDGLIHVGAFSRDSMGGFYRGLLWRFDPGRQWRLSYRILADNQAPVEFSIVMTAVSGKIRCKLE